MRPFEGVKILDCTHVLAGPFAAYQLGVLGADVIKVEPPAGDQTRQWGPPFIKGESSYFLSVNRNKRSVVLDLKTEDGRTTAQALATTSYVGVENVKPGPVARVRERFRAWEDSGATGITVNGDEQAMELMAEITGADKGNRV